MSEGTDDQDLSEVDEIWLGNSASVDGEEFVEALNTVVEVQESLKQFRTSLNDLHVGLDREDAVNLIWGRTNLNKGQIERTFEVMDAIVEEDPGDIAPRLLADKTTELTITEATKVWDDLVQLAEKYGDVDEVQGGGNDE